MMTADQAIKILRHGVDGMGNEGPEYAEIADLLETLTKKWQTMTFNEIRAAITALQPVPDLVSVRLPESEGAVSSPKIIPHPIPCHYCRATGRSISAKGGGDGGICLICSGNRYIWVIDECQVKPGGYL